RSGCQKDLVAACDLCVPNVFVEIVNPVDFFTPGLWRGDLSLPDGNLEHDIGFAHVAGFLASQGFVCVSANLQEFHQAINVGGIRQPELDCGVVRLNSCGNHGATLLAPSAKSSCRSPKATD